MRDVNSQYLPSTTQIPIRLDALVNKKFSRSIAENNGADVYSIVNQQDFADLMDRAYDNIDGYHIGMVGDERVMTVAGTRTLDDWRRNVYDKFTGYKKQTASTKYLQKLDAIAKEFNPDVVVGHSRGAKYIAEMRPLKGMHRLGLDGAFDIASDRYSGVKKDKILNVTQDQVFDKFIAGKHENTYYTSKQNPIDLNLNKLKTGLAFFGDAVSYGVSGKKPTLLKIGGNVKTDVAVNPKFHFAYKENAKYTRKKYVSKRRFKGQSLVYSRLMKDWNPIKSTGPF